MAKDLNLLIVTGRLGKPPVYNPGKSGGSNFVNFSVGVTTNKKNRQTGKWEDGTLWVNCTAFGTQADFINNYIGKGAKVVVTGKPDLNSYTNREGQTVTNLEMVVSEVVKVADGKEGGPAAQTAMQGASIPGYTEDDMDAADIPF